VSFCTVEVVSFCTVDIESFCVQNDTTSTV
jgi:hypothetical protein